MQGECRARRLTVTREDVDDSGWEASLLDEFGGHECRERSLLGGLDDDSVSCSDGRSCVKSISSVICAIVVMLTNLPCPHEQREVPWNDLTTDTDLRRFSQLIALPKRYEMKHRSPALSSSS